MKLTLDTGIVCPNCGKKLDMECGFFASFFVSAILNRIKTAGATITCGQCGEKFWVDPR